MLQTTITDLMTAINRVSRAVGVTGALLWAVLFLPATLVAQESEALPIHKECIDEPVFGRRACVYQANPQAEQTVVLVHGLNGQGLRDWAEQIQPLARHYHVLTFDLPGFGDSDKGPAYYAPATYARFVRYITERYARHPFRLVGHSMGGAIALRYAAEYPADVERLALADVAGVLHRMAYARMLASAWSGQEIGGFFDKMAYKFMTKLEGLTGSANEYLARKLLEHELLDADPQMVAAFTLANEDLGDALNEIRVPVLMLWGENDKVAPLRTAKVLQARLPQAKLVILAGAAHSPMTEAPEAFNRELLAFLSQPPETPQQIDADMLDGLLQLPPPYDERVAEEASTPPQDEEGVARLLPRVGADEPEPELELPPRGKVVCRSVRGTVSEGRIEHLVLNGCDDIVIRNATIGSVQSVQSRAVIENSRIGGLDGTALIAIGSELIITATELSGRVAIHTSRSRLDLAAVKLTARESSVNGEDGSSLIFSVSELSSPLRGGGIHGYFEVDDDNPL